MKNKNDIREPVLLRQPALLVVDVEYVEDIAREWGRARTREGCDVRRQRSTKPNPSTLSHLCFVVL